MAPVTTPWFKKEYKAPKKKYLFLVKLGDVGELWYAKTASKPSISYESGGSLIDGVPFFGDPFLLKDRPSIVYDPISITLIDPVDTGDAEDAATKLMNLIGESHDSDTGYFKIKNQRNKLGSVEIYQYTPGEQNKLEQIETWKLIAPQVTSVKFGDLDYNSDDLLEISIELDYMGFTYTKGSTGGTEVLSRFREIINDKIKIIN